jgi:predicted acylesterase/phospholipase RssA
MQTYYFSNCWAVFEGGGVRASAFAGAFAEATESGMSFSKVAGTSAGALTASLIAAGATPEYIDDHLSRTNFADFLVPPISEEGPFRGRRLLRCLRLLTFGRLRSAITLAIYSGLYSSRGVQIWVEERLKELLSKRIPDVLTRPVRFEDMPIPLDLVAADILHGQPKHWSKEETPRDSVSKAVRCSCSIPFFFQAVKDGSDICVDGGTLSNLPSFLFSNKNPRNAGRFSARIIAFRLNQTASGDKDKLNGIVDFTSAVANTVVSGHTAIEMSMQPTVYTIAINTGATKATDFAGITPQDRRRLYDSGRDAVKQFVAKEKVILSSLKSITTYYGFDEKMLLFVQSLADCTQSFWISDRDSYWLYFIFPALLQAAKRKIKLHFVTSKIDDSDEAHRRHELYRRGLLTRLGVQIHCTERLHFSGFLVDPDTDSMLVAISSQLGRVGRDYKYGEELVKVYTLGEDAAMVETIWNSLKAACGDAAVRTSGDVKIRRSDTSALFDKLKGVRQYREAKFDLEYVSLDDDLLVLESGVKEFKFLQIEGLIGAFEAQGVELFYPQEVVFSDGTSSIVTPPVLESSGGDLVVIEGHTRIYYCFKNKIKYPKIRAVVVRNVTTALPAKPKKLSEVGLWSGTVSSEKPDARFWRDIEERVHPPA